MKGQAKIEITARNLAKNVLEQAKRDIDNFARKSSSDFKSLHTSAKESIEGTKRSLLSLKNVLIGGIGIYTAIKGFHALSKEIENVVGKAIIQEEAVNDLNASLKVSGEFSEGASKKFQKFASSIQHVTKYGDEEVLSLMALIKNLGVHSDRLEEATKMSIGLAAATRRDVASMATYVAMAEQGEFTMLRRYIPALRTTTDKTEQLKIVMDFARKGFQAAEAQTRTFAGQLTQLKNAYGDVLEKLGYVIIKNQAIKDLLDRGKAALEAWGDKIRKWVKANQELIKQKTAEYIHKASEAIKGITAAIKGLIDVYNSLPTGLIEITGGGIIGFMLFGPYGAGVVGVLAAVHVLLKKLRGDIKDSIKFAPNDVIRYHKALKELEKEGSGLGKTIHLTGKDMKYFSGETKKAIEKTQKAVAPLKDISKDPVWKAMQANTKKMFRANQEAYKTAKEKEVKIDIETENKREKLWKKMQDNAKKMFKSNQEAYRTAELTQLKIDEDAKRKLKENDLAYWIAVVNNANTTEDKLREAWDHINAIAEKNNISMTQSFVLGWKWATHRFKTDSMAWLEVGKNAAQTLQKDFSDYFFDAFEGHLRSLKDFWKSIWNDMKAIFLRAIADMLANSLVKTFFGMFGKGFSLNIGKGGTLSTVASGASLAGLVKKVPGVGSALSKVAGALGLAGGGAAATAAGTIGAGAGVTGGATLALGGGSTGATTAGATAAGLGTAAAIGATIAAPIAAVEIAKKVLGHHHMSRAEIVAQDLGLLRKYYGVTSQADYLRKLKQYAGNYPTSFIGWGHEIGWTSKTDKGWQELNDVGAMNYHTGYNVPSWIPKHHDGYYPGEHLAVIRNDETVLTPKQVETVEKSIGATVNINGPLVSITGESLADDAQIEKLARRIRTELTYLEELRQ